jgi:hypothetical protein
MDGDPDRFKVRTDIPRRRNAASIEQNFHVLKRTKISFYTVAGSSCSIRRMRTLVPATPAIDLITEGVYR